MSASDWEGVLRRERLITVLALAALCLFAWVYLLTGAGTQMRPLEMTRWALFPHASPAGAEMPGMAAPAPQTMALAAAMWWVMMIAMMAPSAAPVILLYGRVRRHALAQGQAAPGLAGVPVFVAGYLLVWLGFSLAAAALQWGLERAAVLSPSEWRSQTKLFSAAVLTAAGLYQFSSAQAACLRHCRAPALFLSRHWRPGAAGALRLGVLHGAYCLGCCGVLMLLLFVGGVMNLAWIAALTLLVLAQKILPGGAWTARAAGVALLAWGAATLFA